MKLNNRSVIASTDSDDVGGEYGWILESTSSSPWQDDDDEKEVNGSSRIEDTRNRSNTGRHAIVAATRPTISMGINTNSLIADDVTMLNARSIWVNGSHSVADPVSSSSLEMCLRIFSFVSSNASRRNLENMSRMNTTKSKRERVWWGLQQHSQAKIFYNQDTKDVSPYRFKSVRV